ncbi:MAG: hypothetical protein GXP27_13455 [Planctomycetes bacterium]|nr:hypothetical protein [Planctomycetota bacterium]
MQTNPSGSIRMLLALAVLGSASVQRLDAAQQSMTAFPGSANSLVVLDGGQPYFELSFTGWGPNWRYLHFRGRVASGNGTSRLASSARVQPSGATVSFDVEVRPNSPRQLQLVVNVSTDRDTELTSLIASLELDGKAFAGGKVIVKDESGAQRTVTLPLGRKGLGRSVRRFTLVDAAGRRAVIQLQPPCEIPSDRAARIVLVGRRFSARRARRVTLTVELPKPVAYYALADQLPDDVDADQWFPFRPSADGVGENVLSLSDWIEKPAGKLGRITRDGDRLTYGGRPFKVWGINVCYSSCAPDKRLAERRARFYARYGINAVRLHKFADGPGWAGIQSKDSFAQFDAESLDRMDYFIDQLKKHGIFVALSAHFGTIQIGPDDLKDVPYAEEFGRFHPRQKRITAPASAFFYSPELQQLHIRQIVNLLRHRNPYTGLTYAEDPAIAFVEIINEQSVLFYTSMQPLKASPTLRRSVAKRFCDWLRQRYGRHEALAQAWGRRAFDSFQAEGFPSVGEHLDKNNILPLGNPWYWDPDQLNGSQGFRKRRLLDTLEFLYTLQCEAYDRYAKAVRAAGYDGELIGSNWQAGRAFSHYYNLHSDYRVGLIDRHNYFGGGRGSRFNDASMLRVPGGGMLSAGMQQVIDRPFMLSEWVHVFPNPWGVEGPAILAAYGLGLQGWDASFVFQNRDEGRFLDELGRSRWEVMTPQILGLFPAVARMVLRGDVRESDQVAPRFVHIPSLRDARLDFDDRIVQQYDIKSFDSDKVPAQALAAARCVIDFTDRDRSTPMFDLIPYRHDGALVSSTRQLRWFPGQTKHDGMITIDTRATKAVIGFAEGRRFQLGSVTITPQSRFAAIFVTARQRDRDLSNAKDILLIALARARNTGMKTFGNRLIQRGGPPIRLEPVRAEIRLQRRGRFRVYRLDHSGRLTQETLTPLSGTIRLDTGRDRTPYYLIRYE